MTTIRLPLLGASLALVFGIALGRLLPVLPSLLCVCGLLVVCVPCTLRWRFLREWVVMLLWVMAGLLRVGISTSSAPRLLDGVRPVAMRCSQALTCRLQAAGVADAPLRLTSSLLIGRKDMLLRHERDAFRQTGTAHLLALSGMHLGVLYALVNLLVVRWVRFSRLRWLCLPVVLSLVWGYVFIAGAPQSLVRAAIMVSVLCVSTFASRSVELLHLLSLSAMLMLLYDPSNLWDIGFQLSFVAVFFIAILYVPLSNIIVIRNNVVRWSVQLLLLSVVAQMATAPLSIYWFHAFPAAGFLASVVMVPVVSVLLYVGVAALLFPCVLTGWMVSRFAQIILWCSDCMQVLTAFTIRSLYPSLFSVLLMYLGLLLFTFRLRRQLSAIPVGQMYPSL